jgi:phosphopantothenoylcysteine decarboxylase/phosphopantothenate--cysteine ligase
VANPNRPSEPPLILVTAGPTLEPIDEVRYLANRSSGRMGVAIALEAASRGLPTTLLLGPGPLDPPQVSHLRTVRFRTTDDLQRLLGAHWPAHDVLVMAAAVADYRPSRTAPGKLPRRDRPLTLELEPTPDLLLGLRGCTRPDQTVIGFALAPGDDLQAAATEKLRRKGLDAIVANPLATMDAATVTAVVLLADGRVLTPGCDLTKGRFAAWLLDRLPVISAQRTDRERS